MVAQCRGALSDRTAEDLGGKMCCDGRLAENHNSKAAENQDGMMAEDYAGKTMENQVDATDRTQGDNKTKDIDNMLADVLGNKVFALELNCVMAPLRMENVYVHVVQTPVGLEEMSFMCSLSGNCLACMNHEDHQEGPPS